jgi:competence protein ComEA
MLSRRGFARALCIGVFAAGALLTRGAFGQKTEGDAAREDKADKAAFVSVCGSCHPASMVDSLKSEPEWRETVELMVKVGAKGTDEQFDRLMRFLLRNWTKVNVNVATAAEIAPVLDVSNETAEAIVKRRAENGGFKTIDELKKIPGVNAEKIEMRKDRVAF